MAPMFSTATVASAAVFSPSHRPSFTLTRCMERLYSWDAGPSTQPVAQRFWAAVSSTTAASTARLRDAATCQAAASPDASTSGVHSNR